MDPLITEEKELLLIGMSFYGDPFDTHSGWDEDNQIGRIWKRFTAYLAAHEKELAGKFRDKYCYEVHIYSEDTRTKGLFEVFVGVEGVFGDGTFLGSVPIDLSIKTLPKTKYAVFTFQGQDIVSDWEKMIQEWMGKSGVTSRHSFNFQCYDERFKGLDHLAESTLEVYVPIENAA